MKPSKNIIGDKLYTQYTKLQVKQIRDWNKRQKEKMVTLASFKRIVRSTTQQEISTSNTQKLDWMIHWIQELGPIFQEYARKNNMRVPNYSPDMFGLMHHQQETKEQGSEEREDSKDKGEEEEEGERMRRWTLMRKKIIKLFNL